MFCISGRRNTVSLDAARLGCADMFQVPLEEAADDFTPGLESADFLGVQSVFRPVVGRVKAGFKITA